MTFGLFFVFVSMTNSFLVFSSLIPADGRRSTWLNADASAHRGFSMNYIIDCRCAPNTKCNYVMRRAKLSHYPPNYVAHALLLSSQSPYSSLGTRPSLNLCLSRFWVEGLISNSSAVSLVLSPFFSRLHISFPVCDVA